MSPRRKWKCIKYNTLYPQKLALTSPTSGGRSVGIVCLRTRATEFSFILIKWKAYFDLFHKNVGTM
jgi:hypothetical protein